MLEGLHEVRADRIFKKNAHRTFCLKSGSTYDVAVHVVSDRDIGKTLLKVFHIGSKAEDRHDLGGCRDGEYFVSRNAVDAAAYTEVQAAKGTVVHVKAALPQDPVLVEVQLISLIKVVVDHGR